MAIITPAHRVAVILKEDIEVKYLIRHTASSIVILELLVCRSWVRAVSSE